MAVFKARGKRNKHDVRSGKGGKIKRNHTISRETKERKKKEK